MNETLDDRAQQFTGTDARAVIVAGGLALIFGLGISAFAVVTTQASNRRDARAQFDRLAERLTTEAQRRVNLPVYGLNGARGVYAADESIGRLQFRAYVASRNLPSEFPGVLGIGFIQRVIRPNLPTFVANERVDHAPDFSVKSVGDAPDLYVVKYIEPLDSNRAAWGWDVGSNTVRRAALKQAVQTGEPTLSGRVMLPQDAHQRAGFVYVVPVYRNDSSPATPAEREKALVGLVYAPIVIEEAFAGLAEAADGKLDLEVFDGEELIPSNLLLDANGTTAPSAEKGSQSKRGSGLFHDVKRVRVGGREWSLAFSTTPKFDASVDRTPPILVGSAGALLSALIAAVIWFLGQGRRRALALAGLTHEMNAQLLNAKGQAEAMTREVQDQSAAMQIERERMELALMCGGLGTWDWNPQTGVSRFDLRVAAILGEESLGTHFDCVKSRVHPDDLPLETERIEKHFRGEAAIYESVSRIRHKTGVWRWVRSRGVVVSRNAEQQPTRMVGISEDITERKELEKQLAQSQRLESIGELAAGIAHEINTPTQYVGDNIRFLKTHFGSLMRVLDKHAEYLNGPQKPWNLRVEEITRLQESLDFEFLRQEIPQAISQSLEGTERVAAIVRAMKDFSHPGLTTKEAGNLNRSILSTIEVCRHRWKYVADLETDLADDLPPVPCLIAEFNQVILNLIVNASDAIAETMNSGGAKQKGLIQISTRIVGDCAEIRVRDNGPGIPPAIADRIFDPFFTTKPVGKGTGQGLALSRNVIVKKHGGELQFEPAPDGGTVFIVRLPISESHVQKSEAA